MQNTIVFFDGYCGLCNGFVDFCLREDSKRVLRFAPLQGSTASSLLNSSEITDLSTIVVMDPSSTKLYKSEAVLFVMSQLGGVWRFLFATSKIVPRPLRNIVYDWCAKNRYFFFGKRETCRLPSQQERAQFLD